MSFDKVERQQPMSQAGVQEKQPMPLGDGIVYPQNNGKKGYAPPPPMAAVCPNSPIKTPVEDLRLGVIDDADEIPHVTPREVNLLATSPPPTYADKAEEKRARLLENAAKEARDRRVKEAEAEGRPLSTVSRATTAKHQPSPTAGAQEPENTGSTVNLLKEDAWEEEEDQQNMSIGEILKLKMAQKADKKKPRKVIAS